MFGNLGAGELLVIFLIVILLFGGKKIPEIAKGLGKGIKDFRSSLNGTDDEEQKKLKGENPPNPGPGGPAA